MTATFAIRLEACCTSAHQVRLCVSGWRVIELPLCGLLSEGFLSHATVRGRRRLVGDARREPLEVEVACRPYHCIGSFAL